MTEPTARFFVRLSHEWTLPVMCLPIVFGAVAYRARKLQARAWTLDDPHVLRFSRAAYIASCLLFMASFLLFGVSLMHIGCAAGLSLRAQCQSNLKQLGTAALMYAYDYDEHFPPASRWSEAIASQLNKNLKDGQDLFQCPSAESPASYGMNTALSGLSLADLDTPDKLVLLFEADAPIRSFAGGKSDLARQRHGGTPNVVYADGHTRYANPYAQQQLNWIPKKVAESETRP